MIFCDAYACHSPPFTPLHPPCWRQVSARGFHGSLCCVWRHPLAEAEASPSGVLRSSRYAQKKQRSLSLSIFLFLSLSEQHPKIFKDVCAHATWHSPFIPPAPSHSVWRVQCLLQRTKQPSRALLHFTILLLLLLLLLFTRTQTTLLRAFWRVKLCCCAAAAHSQTAAPTHTHTVAEIERQREHTCIQRSQQQIAHSSRFRSLAAPLSLSLPLLVRGFAAAECSQTCIAVTCDVAAQRSVVGDVGIAVAAFFCCCW